MERRWMMREEKKRFLEVMRIELEDLHDDIDFMMKHCDKIFHEHQITEIGYFGNLAVLKSELRGLGIFAQILDSCDPAEYKTLEDLADDLEKKLLNYIKKFCMPPAVDMLVRRKIDKAMSYVRN